MLKDTLNYKDEDIEKLALVNLELKDALQAAKSDCTALQEQIQELEVELELCKEEKAVLADEINENLELKRYQALAQQLEREKRKDSDTIQALQERLAQAENENHEIKSALDAQVNSEQIIIELSARNDTLTAKVAEQDAALQDFEALSSVHNEIELKQSEFETDILNELNSCRRQLENYRERFSALADLAEWEQRALDAETKADFYTTKCKELARELSRANKSVTQLQMNATGLAAKDMELQILGTIMAQLQFERSSLSKVCLPVASRNLQSVFDFSSVCRKLALSQECLKRLYAHSNVDRLRPPQFSEFSTPAKAPESVAALVNEQGSLTVDLAQLHDVFSLQMLLFRVLNALQKYEAQLFAGQLSRETQAAIARISSVCDSILSIFKSSNSPLESIQKSCADLAKRIVSADMDFDVSESLVAVNVQLCIFNSGVPVLLGMLYTAWKRLGDFAGKTLKKAGTPLDDGLESHFRSVFDSVTKYLTLCAMSITCYNHMESNLAAHRVLCASELGANVDMLLREAEQQCSVVYQLLGAWSRIASAASDSQVFETSGSSISNEMLRASTGVLLQFGARTDEKLSVHQVWADFKRRIDVFTQKMTVWLAPSSFKPCPTVEGEFICGVLVPMSFFVDERTRNDVDADLLKDSVSRLSTEIAQRERKIADQEAVLATFARKISELPAIEHERLKIARKYDELTRALDREKNNNSSLETRCQQLEKQFQKLDIASKAPSIAKPVLSLTDSSSSASALYLQKAVGLLQRENAFLRERVSLKLAQELVLDLRRYSACSLDRRNFLALQRIQGSKVEFDTVSTADSEAIPAKLKYLLYNIPMSKRHQRQQHKKTEREILKKLSMPDLVDLSKAITNGSTLYWTPFIGQPLYQFQKSFV